MLDPSAHQDAVNRRFESDAQRWADYYEDASVDGIVYRARQSATLDWLGRLDLSAGVRALDAGCGTGELTFALAERGYSVEAVDSAPAMIARVQKRGAAGVHATVGDVTSLPFPDETFDVVTALGLLPWVPSPEAVVRELTRVLCRGGHAVLTVDNGRRLTYLLDPRMTPGTQSFKRAVRRARKRETIHAVVAPSVLDRYVADAGLESVASRTIGFGPFTMFSVPFVPTRLGIAAHERLQARADAGNRFLRNRGAHYMVIARRPDSRP